MPAWTPGVVAHLEVPGATAPKFRSTLRSEGINVVVSVPESVSTWFGEVGHVAVLGLIDSVGVTATLVPAGGGRHKLYLNKEMRSAAGLEVGDEPDVVLWRDTSQRATVLPRDLEEALAAQGLLDAFLDWAPSRRREYVLAIEDAKKPETRARRIRITVDLARSGLGSDS